MDHLEDRTVPSVTLGVHVLGINAGSSSCGCEPPDGAEAVGPTNAIQAVNTAMEITNKSGTVVSGPTSLATFFSGHGFTVNTLSDPVVYYDEAAQRFLILILDFTSGNAPDNLDIAISNNSDATAGFTNFRQIAVGEGSFFADQPRLGINADAYFVQFNMFTASTGTYAHPQVLTIQKSSFLTGGLTTFHHDMNSALFSVDPANMHGAAAGGPEYFVTEDATTVGNIDVITETNVLSNTPTDTTTVLTGPSYGQPAAANQPSGTITTNDSRMMDAEWRNNVLVATHTIGNSAGTANARWYQISTTSTPSLTMRGDINPGTGVSTFFPSIDIDTNGDFGMTYMESSSSESVSMYVTGRTPTDPSGTMETAVKAVAGSANYGGTRAGDYSQVSVDPSTGTTFWGENEIINSGGTNWATGIASWSVASANKNATTTTVSSGTNPSSFGQSVTFTATVTSSGATPTGTVTFNDGATSIGSGTLSGGSTTFSTSSLSVGNHNITASYGGDANSNSSASSAITQTVNKANSSTSLASSTNPTVFGQSTTFTATVTGSGATGTVTFLDGGTSIGSGSVSGGKATFSTSSLSVATHAITASYGGDANFNGSTSSAVNQTVNKDGTSTTVASSANPSTTGSSVTFTATVSASSPGSGAPTGTVTFNDGGTSIGSGSVSGGKATFSTSSLSTGTHTITASYGGDGNFNGSTSGAIVQTVNAPGATTTTSVSSGTNPSVFGQSVTFTATVTTSGSNTPTGTVTFFDGGSSIGSGTLSGGSATFTTSSLSVANHSITASYGGDANNNSSSSTAITQTVNKASTSTSVASSANPSVFGQTVTFTATVSAVSPGAGTPTGTVTFSDGGTSIGTGTLSGGQANFSTTSLSVATHAITASYGGDANFSASSSGTVNQTVNQDGTTTTVASSANPSSSGAAVTFTATVSANSPGSGTATGTVTFLDGGTSIGTGGLSGGKATFSTSSLSVGNHTITASYGGDANFTGSTSAAIVQTVNSGGGSTAPVLTYQAQNVIGGNTAVGNSGFATVSGLSITLTTGVDLVRISGSLGAYNKNTAAYNDLYVRILVDGAVQGGPYGYSFSEATSNFYVETVNFENDIKITTAGTHTVVVQATSSSAVNVVWDPGTAQTLRVTDYHTFSSGSDVSTTQVNANEGLPPTFGGAGTLVSNGSFATVPGLTATISTASTDTIRLSATLSTDNNTLSTLPVQVRFLVDGTATGAQTFWQTPDSGPDTIRTVWLETDFANLAAGTHTISVQAMTTGTLYFDGGTATVPGGGGTANFYQTLRVTDYKTLAGSTPSGSSGWVNVADVNANDSGALASSYTNVPGLSSTFTSNGTNAVRLDATLNVFNTSTSAYGFPAVRFLIDGVTATSNNSWNVDPEDSTAQKVEESLNYETFATLAAGTHTVTVQAQSTQGTVSFENASGSNQTFHVAAFQNVSGISVSQFQALAAALAYEEKLQANGEQTNAFGFDDGGNGSGDTATSLTAANTFTAIATKPSTSQAILQLFGSLTQSQQAGSAFGANTEMDALLTSSSPLASSKVDQLFATSGSDVKSLLSHGDTGSHDQLFADLGKL
jgi:hypothetical protein